MKKLFILFAAVAMMTTTACNEKPSKAAQPAEKQQTEAEALNDTTGKKPGIDVQKAAPTPDGKDHTVAEFNTADYQVRLENLADGNFRLSLWKPGADKSSAPDQVVKTKKCVMQKDNYLMKDADGKVYVIKSTAGSEELTIMDQKKITYHGSNAK